MEFLDELMSKGELWNNMERTEYYYGFWIGKGSIFVILGFQYDAVAVSKIAFLMDD